VSVPTYVRSDISPSVVHIGSGRFHRSHQAKYFDDVAEKGVSTQWGVTTVSLHNRDAKAALSRQDCLYTLVERCGERDTARVIGALRGCLFAPEDHRVVVRMLADPRTRLVTLTITGEGYHLDSRTGQFDAECGAVVADLSSRGPYDTVWAYLAEALDDRRRNGIPPFTVMSCDNLPDNGAAARAALSSYAALLDPGLARWIERNVAFPSSMVDRITPKWSSDDGDLVQRLFGVTDRLPVFAEPFSQWVIEDTFCNERPPLHEVGAEIVGDVAPHKLTKSRLLNGTHCAIAYLGILAGYKRIDEAMAEPVVYRYVERLMREEIAPLLPRVPGLDVDAYQRTLIERLVNPKIGDQLARLAARGSTKMPAYLLPSLIEARAQGRPHALLTLAVAAWMRYLRGYDSQGNAVHVEDARSRELTTLAKMGQSDPRPLLDVRDVFHDLGEDDDLVRELKLSLREFDRARVLDVLRERLAYQPARRTAAE
jgi:mannitol 2-dehydrogenase